MNSNLNSYYTFNDRYSSENRMTRNFEELVTERGELEFGEVQSEFRFENLFNNIKDKIFSCSEGDDIDLSEEQRKSFEEKFNIKKSSETIKDLKQKISELYFKKIEHSVMIEERRRLFKTFTKNLSTILCIIGEMKPLEEDTELKRLLEKRIDAYYEELELEKLIEREYNLNSEFQFLRKTLIELSQISLTQCTVCLDRNVSWFIDPCGHTLCEECKDRTDSCKNCHYCRAKRTKFSRLYL